MRTLFAFLAIAALTLIGFGARAQQSADTPSEFVLHVDRQGAYFVAEDSSGPAPRASSVVERAASALSRNPNITLVVEADEGAPEASVVRAAELLKQTGTRKIVFRTAD